MAAPTEKIRQRIATVAQSELELAPAAAQDLAFHMTDWLEDLESFGRFVDDPGSPSDSDVRDLLVRFLVHVPNHVAAACKLATGIPVTDIFGVGATTEAQD